MLLWVSIFVIFCGYSLFGFLFAGGMIIGASATGLEKLAPLVFVAFQFGLVPLIAFAGWMSEWLDPEPLQPTQISRPYIDEY